MELPESDKSQMCPEESEQLHRNRSFKSKQLVRSQAIRESQSPPRTVSPNCTSSAIDDSIPVSVQSDTSKHLEAAINRDDDNRTISDNIQCVSDTKVSSQVSVNNRYKDNYSDTIEDNEKKVQHVAIQITSGAWDAEITSDQRQRTKRWLGHKYNSDTTHDFLSNNPRITCVCGGCKNRGGLDDLKRSKTCPDCRGKRRKRACPAKQDSGIVCSDECPDCSDLQDEELRLRKVDSQDDMVDLQNLCRCQERKEKPKNISLIRNDSDEKYEPTGADLVKFLKDTLNKNARDRLTLLRIEKELHNLVNDIGRCIVRFPVMTSYGRMLVHRCAALFQLSHHLDQQNKNCVLVSKTGTSGGRIPCTGFKQWCTATFPQSPIHQQDSTQAKSILKRDAHSLDDPSSGNIQGGGVGARSKSLEQREEEYERVRRRIFSSNNCVQDEPWPWLNAGPVKVLTSETGKNRLLKVQSLESSGPPQPQPTRGAVSKSHSFGGYGREEPQPRILSRQGDLASSSWRLSPSSSGYKTLSLRSTDSVTPSPTGGVSPEPGVPSSEGSLVWAVTDLSSVPPGALIIHPQTGRPLTNPDGSLYHYDPSQPPMLLNNGNQVKAEKNLEKRRGRLEKQNSFIDNECECPQVEEYRQKCCCCDAKRPCQGWKDECDQCEAPRLTDKGTSPLKDQSSEQIPTPNQDHPENQTQEVIQYTMPYNENFRTEDEVNKNQKTVPMYQQVSSPKTLIPYHDPNIRPMSNSTMYSAAVSHTSYPYTNHCRMDPNIQQQQIYPTLIQEAVEPKVAQEPAFRIDQSYPFPTQPIPETVPTDMRNFIPGQYIPNVGHYGHNFAHNLTCAGACGVDPVTGIFHCLGPAQRSYGVAYGQGLEQNAGLGQTYPIGNIFAPQTTLQQYPYTPTVQWPMMTTGLPSNCGTPIQKSSPPPNLFIPQPDVPLYQTVNYPKPEMINYHNQLYPFMQYHNYTYPQSYVPQIVPQYPMCPVYPVLDNQVRRNSRSYENIQKYRRTNSITNSSRNTPLESCTPPISQESKKSETSNELTVKIQQIKEQMAQLNVSNEIVDKTPRVEKVVINDIGKLGRQRNLTGNGILGDRPNNAYNRISIGACPINDESQLSSAARAIVDTIRTLQSKSVNHQTQQNYHPRNQKNQDGFRNYERDHRQRDNQPSSVLNSPDGSQSRAESQPRIDPALLGRTRPVNPVESFPCRPYMLRQMSPGTWCRRSPGPLPPGINRYTPRRPPPDTRNQRR